MKENSGTIEDDGTVELYFKYKVGKIYGDTSTAVPSGIMKYAHWTYWKDENQNESAFVRAYFTPSRSAIMLMRK